MGIYICVSEILFAVTFILSVLFAMKFSTQLMNLLKANYGDRYGELSGAKLIGKEWVGGGRTSKGFGYIFNDQDNEITEILSLKKRVKKALLIVLMACGCFGLNALIYVIATS
jgi:hypothetical protein